ncbi:MAG: flagellar export chaperone FliS [Sphingorhabdus sp.]
MFPRTHPAAANQQYRNLELQSRVASASPHGLVSILYEELLRALDLLSASLSRGNTISGNPHHGKALSIIIALESSIDFANGGDLANILQRIYRSSLRTLNDAARANDASGVTEVRSAISDISYAWNALAH